MMPSFEPRFSINMETSLPGQVTTVDQDSHARQIGCGGKGESFPTISAAFPPRSGFVQPVVSLNANTLQRLNYNRAASQHQSGLQTRNR